MGVLNVTPDSFSDGGEFLRLEDAVAHGKEMVRQGADVVDVGGESSRPGAIPVEESVELARVVPVVEALAGTVRISVDTVKPAVARAALRAGAAVINDISGRLWPVAAEAGAGWVSVHMQGTPRDMQRDPRYQDVVGEVTAELLSRGERAAMAGVSQVWLDPGIGFGKTLQHNLRLLAHIGELVDAAEAQGQRVLVGTSRKGFLGEITRRANEGPLPARDRFEGSLATAVWCMAQGVDMVRVHDVAPTVQAAALCAPVEAEPAA